MKQGSIFVILWTAFASQCAFSIQDVRPNHLTDEDFATARQASSITTMSDDDYSPAEDHHRQKRNAFKHMKWPNARIPYTLDPGFDDHQRAEVARAFENYHNNTCVRFVPRQESDADYVQILRDDKTCGLAQMCKAGGAQFAKFGGQCISFGTMTHELGHTLCFGHEQTRPDRDQWIEWDTKICEPHGLDHKDHFTSFDLFYDYVSIQHYEGECYNGCIKPKMKGVTKCGSGGTLSVLDIEKINAFYECKGCHSYRFRPSKLLSSNNENLVITGVVNGTNLYSCRAYHLGSIVPGWADLTNKSCWVGWNGTGYEVKDNFEILTNPQNAKLDWVKHTNETFPANAIRGGRSSEREPFYIGRCIHGDLKIPGKIHRSGSQDMYVVIQGKEYLCGSYEILVCHE